MKSAAILLLLTLGAGHFCVAQDVITQRNGDTIAAKVLRVKPDDIEYKLFTNQDGPVHVIARADVRRIVYENGTKDVFDDQPSRGTSHISMAQQGTMDAQINYKPPMIGPVFAGIFLGYGFIPAVISFATPPRYERLNFPDENLMDNAAYRDAYMSKAARIKRTRVAEGYGIGTAIIISIIGGIVIATLSH